MKKSKSTRKSGVIGDLGTVFLIVAGVFFAVSLGFLFWALDAMPASEEALIFLSSTQDVEVRFVGDDIYFIPKVSRRPVGLIFYPGGKVDHRAYSPLLHRLAQRGYFGVILKAPLNLAFLRTNGAEDVLKRFPNVRWFVGGHSLGGVAASEYFKDNHDKLEGLILLASYPANDLSKVFGKRVLVLYATNDGLVTPEAIERTREFFPKSTVFVLIEGGNHSQFGYYGSQDRDRAATITREEQQRLVLEKISEVLGDVPVGKPDM